MQRFRRNSHEFGREIHTVFRREQRLLHHINTSWLAFIIWRNLYPTPDFRIKKHGISIGDNDVIISRDSVGHSSHHESHYDTCLTRSHGDTNLQEDGRGMMGRGKRVGVGEGEGEAGTSDQIFLCAALSSINPKKQTMSFYSIAVKQFVSSN